LVFVLGLVRLYRGKIFARWVYKNATARDDMTDDAFLRTQLHDDATLFVCKLCILVKCLRDIKNPNNNDHGYSIDAFGVVFTWT
jgi:hypothetical protein